MKISVLGSGYVGLVTGACFADLGNDVTCMDVDADKVNMLNRGEVPIYEPGLSDLIKRNASEDRLRFSLVESSVLGDSEVIFICVGTPQGASGKADLQYILDAGETIAKSIQKHAVIVTKSTVPVGTAMRLTRVISAITDVEFDVVSNPEFLKEGAAIKDFQNPDRIVIGVDSERAKMILTRLYSAHARISRPILFVKPETAELIKYAANAMLASRISFMNALTPLCEKLGADIKDVGNGMGLDSRIGPRFLQASPGYGGSCFPKDVRALVDTLESHQMNANFFRAIDVVNERHKKSHINRLLKWIPDLHNIQVAVWGLSFKPRTDDIRESSSLTVIDQLLEHGARVTAYDPEAIENTRKVFPQVEYTHTPYDAATGASAVMIMTEWDVFRNIDLERVKSVMERPVMVDCRNIYEPHILKELGFEYSSVGRR